MLNVEWKKKDYYVPHLYDIVARGCGDEQIVINTLESQGHGNFIVQCLIPDHKGKVFRIGEIEENLVCRYTLIRRGSIYDMIKEEFGDFTEIADVGLWRFQKTFHGLNGQSFIDIIVNNAKA